MSRVKLLMAVLMPVLLVSAFPRSARAQVAVDPSRRYQTILGWGGTAWGPQMPDALRNQVLDELVYDLGLTRLRLEPPSGNDSAGQRWEWNNDNGDPFQTDWAQLNTTGLDNSINDWIVPFKQRVEAAGKPFNLYVSPSFYYNGKTGTAPPWLLNSPGEYAEYATSILLHLKNAYGITADYYSICNEAGNDNAFSAARVGTMIKALGPRMQQLGLSTKIVLSEGVSADVTWQYVQALRNDPKVWPHVGALSYHLYGGGAWAKNNIRDFALARGLPTAETECMGTTINQMYDDLVNGGVSYWEHYALSGQGPTPPSGTYVAVDYAGTGFYRYGEYWKFRQVMHYVQPGDVRVEATSGDAYVRALAFDRAGQRTTVLLNTTGGGNRSVTLSGLPGGTYGVSQSADSAAYQENGLATVGADGQLQVTVPSNGVLTVYPYAGANQAPTLTGWGSSVGYLKVGGATAAPLWAMATDAELNAISYAWVVKSQPAGAAASLSSPASSSPSANGLTLPGQYVFTVTASDGAGSVSRDVAVNVYAGNQAPMMDDVHNRQPAQLTLPAETSTSLRAWAWDIENDPLTYQWTVLSQPAGAAVSLGSPAAASASAFDMTVPGDYVFRVTARDGTDSASRDLTVTVYPENVHAPGISAIAGAATNIALASTTLSATTGDLDGDVISHWWSVKSAPAGADPIIMDPNLAQTGVAGLTVPGDYVFNLIVVDRTKMATSDVTVAVNPEPAALWLLSMAGAILLRRGKRQVPRARQNRAGT